jgi:aerobic carbon-monoxide dehydrogenase large subunit
VPPYVTDLTETPATTNPLGAKSAGESGTIAATPAVVNAVVDALRPYGVTDVRMPCTPERVWRAIHPDSASGRAAAGTAASAMTAEAGCRPRETMPRDPASVRLRPAPHG